MSVTGRVWKFGDDINTDLIIPGKYLENYDPSHLAAHAMEGANKEFAKAVSKGDIIVGGNNFGCGSSREQAVVALKQSGVAAVVAKSFARIFYRNSVSLGLVVLVSRDACDLFQDGEMATLDSDSSSLVSNDVSRKAHLEETPPHIKAILDHGGLVPYLKQKLAVKSR